MDKSPDAFRTISEVAEDLDLPQHVLRFWETRFNQIKPLKRGGGRRYYRPDDIELLKGIRHLLYGEGYTIKGVQRILKTEGIRFVQSVGRGEQNVDAPEKEERADNAEAAPGWAGTASTAFAVPSTNSSNATASSPRCVRPRIPPNRCARFLPRITLVGARAGARSSRPPPTRRSAPGCHSSSAQAALTEPRKRFTSTRSRFACSVRFVWLAIVSMSCTTPPISCAAADSRPTCCAVSLAWFTVWRRSIPWFRPGRRSPEWRLTAPRQRVKPC